MSIFRRFAKKKNEAPSAPEALNSRRQFVTHLGAAAGASLLLGRSATAAFGDGSAPLDKPATAWPASFDALATRPQFAPRETPKEGEKIHKFRIEVTIGEHEIVPGVKAHMFLFNGTYPGPEIRVPENEWVQIDLVNSSPENHTIHWHGMILANEMDGVPMGTQWPVFKDQTFRYLFRAQPAGTHFYHCHVMTTLHQMAGLVGSLIVESKDDIVKKTFPYEREYTMLLSEIDTAWAREQLNEMVGMGMTMDAMNKDPKLMKEMNGRMMGWFKDKKSFLDAIKGGYTPPYLSSMTGANRVITPNFFMINGKSYPMTDELFIKYGENIRVRLIGGGMMPHFIHLHGHDFWHVCQDGSPLAAPVRLNTIPIFPGTTSDIVIQGTNPGNWHFHDHSDLSTTNNGIHPGGMMTMLMYEDAEKYGVTFKDTIMIDS
jgi:FtsP/CotA-like multicopper oxidase with cupredoxin domain